MGDLMHGRGTDPEKLRSTNGIRLSPYVNDAIRAVVATSRGKWTKETLVQEAIKQFLPPEILTIAWQDHGGVGTPPGVYLPETPEQP